MADADEPLRLEVLPEPLPAEITKELRSALLSNAVVRTHYPTADLWLVGLDFLHKGEPDPEDENLPFHAVLADMAGSVVVDAYGRLWELDSIDALTTSRQRLPNDEEHAWAADLVRRSDPALAARLDAGEARLYRPVPPLASRPDDDGSIVRAVTIGVREQAGGAGDGDGGPVTHRILAVHSAEGDVTELAGPFDTEAGLPDRTTEGAGAGPATTPVSVTSDQVQARVRVSRGDEALWDFVVVRPQASTGANGSGVELRNVDYQGVRVLHRAHVPIVNVAFEDGRASRTWLNEESAFEAIAEGEDPLPGFRVAAAGAASRTILDAGEQAGDFRGVALHLDGDELVLTSQLQAGWYRYVQEWRLRADGAIRPRFGFAATHNPATHAAHTHHAYWRLDFDVVNPGQNLVQEHNDPTLPGQLAPWHTIRWETRRDRDPAHQREWRVRSVRTPHGYAIVPGPDDGHADAFGAGDVWILAEHGDEIDDGEGVTSDPARARAGLDRLVSGELVERADVVVWYGIHVDGETPAAGSSLAGPSLEPFLWRKIEKATYVPLAPPETFRSADDDDDEDDEDDDEAGQ